MAGLHPCEGKIEFKDGTNLHKHPVEFRRRVNYSEAEPLYPGFLTAKDLVRFVGKAKGANKEQHEYFVEKFGVSEFFEKPCETFSSGMLKKLSLALAFLGSPKLIILDEPLITLDAKARITLLQIIERYLKEHEVTFLFSSHQAIESQSIALSGSFIVSNKTILPC